MTDRKILLERLVRAEESSTQLSEQLRAHGWDADEAVIVLTRRDVDRVLSRYLDGEFDALRVREWADAIEVREDIDLDPVDSDVLSELLFELANPEINHELDRRRAKRWRERLGRRRSD